jgi:hypothetical protein
MSTTDKSIKSPLQNWGATPPNREITDSFHKAIEAAIFLATKEWSKDKTDKELEIVFDEPAEKTRRRLGLD